MEVERVRGTVTGRVQGVWFRASMRDEARRIGVTGWVRNRPDGAVEFEAQGPPDAIRALLDWAADGPPRARVSDLEWSPLAPVDEDRDFIVT